MISDLADHRHQLFCFLRVHTGSRFIKKQQLWICRKRSCDFQTSLRTIRQVSCFCFRILVQTENTQQFHCLFICFLFCLVIGWQTQDSSEQSITDGVMHTCLDIVKNCQLIEKSDILECTGYTCNVGCYRIELCHVLSAKTDCTTAWLVHFCQHVEDGCLTCTVRTDQAIDFTLIDIQIQIINGCQTTKVNTKSSDFKYFFSVFHTAQAPFFILRLKLSTALRTFWLFVTIIMTIRTIAYTSIL